MTDLTLRAWAYLSRVVEPPCAELAALVSGVGPIEAAERVRRGLVDDVLARHTEARRESTGLQTILSCSPAAMVD